MTRSIVKWARIFTVIYLVTVLFLCFGKFDTGPDIPMSLWGLPADKLVHFVMFLPFPVLLFFSLDGLRLGRKQRFHALLCIIGAGILVAAATETAQYFIPWRSGEWRDLLADSLGILSSSMLLAPIVCRKD